MKHGIKCPVCGASFEAKTENRYTTYEPRSIFNALAYSDVPSRDTFDCPECGCQVVVGVRYPTEIVARNSPKEA